MAMAVAVMLFFMAVAMSVMMFLFVAMAGSVMMFSMGVAVAVFVEMLSMGVAGNKAAAFEMIDQKPCAQPHDQKTGRCAEPGENLFRKDVLGGKKRY